MKKIDVGRIFGGLYCILFIGIGYGLTFLSKIEGLEKAELIFSIVIAFWVFMALFEIQAILNRNAKLRKASNKDIEQGPFPYIDSIELLVLGICFRLSRATYQMFAVTYSENTSARKR